MIPNNARNACGDDNCHASKELSNLKPSWWNRRHERLSLSMSYIIVTESVHVVTYEMNRENCWKALRALSATT